MDQTPQPPSSPTLPSLDSPNLTSTQNKNDIPSSPGAGAPRRTSSDEDTPPPDANPITPTGGWEMTPGALNDPTAPMSFTHTGTQEVKGDLSAAELEIFAKSHFSRANGFTFQSMASKRRPEDQDRGLMGMVPKFIAGVYKRRWLKLSVGPKPDKPTLLYFDSQNSKTHKGEIDVDLIEKVNVCDERSEELRRRVVGARSEATKR